MVTNLENYFGLISQVLNVVLLNDHMMIAPQQSNNHPNKNDNPSQIAYFSFSVQDGNKQRHGFACVFLPLTITPIKQFRRVFKQQNNNHIFQFRNIQQKPPHQIPSSPSYSQLSLLHSTPSLPPIEIQKGIQTFTRSPPPPLISTPKTKNIDFNHVYKKLKTLVKQRCMKLIDTKHNQKST